MTALSAASTVHSIEYRSNVLSVSELGSGAFRRTYIGGILLRKIGRI